MIRKIKDGLGCLLLSCMLIYKYIFNTTRELHSMDRCMNYKYPVFSNHTGDVWIFPTACALTTPGEVRRPISSHHARHRGTFDRNGDALWKVTQTTKARFAPSFWLKCPIYPLGVSSSSWYPPAIIHFRLGFSSINQPLWIPP